MKIVVFGAQRRVGLWQDDNVIDINNAAAAYFSTEMSRADAVLKAASAAPADLAGFIVAGEDALALAVRAANHVKGSSDSSLIQPITGAKLHAPWPGRRIFANGGNYGQHAANAFTNGGKPTTSEQFTAEARRFPPLGFAKIPTEVMGPGDEILYPSRTSRFDFEAELAVILGVDGKNIAAEEAGKHIWGVALANDWSIRDDPPGLFPGVSFNLMKNFDCSVSLGPCIVVGAGDVQDIDISLTVNDEMRQDYSTKEMIYSVAETLAYLSRDFTLVAGDVLICGTGAGTALDMSKRDANGKPLPDLFLKVGDEVEVRSSKIGSLHNRIVAG